MTETCQRCGHTMDGYCIAGILKRTHCDGCELLLRAANTAALYDTQEGKETMTKWKQLLSGASCA